MERNLKSDKEQSELSTEDRKIVCYSIDDKTAKSLELQFKREKVYNMIYSKILSELAELNKK